VVSPLTRHHATESKAGSGPPFSFVRCEVNARYGDRLEQHSMRFSGISPVGLLPEIA
jgi:hypothetical protein